MGKENSNVPECCSFVGTNIKFGCKMARKLTLCSRDGNYANLIDYFVVNGRLAGSTQDTRVYRSAAIDVKSKDHHLVMSRVNLKLKFRKGNFLPGSYDAGRFQGETSGKTS